METLYSLLNNNIEGFVIKDLGGGEVTGEWRRLHNEELND